jgi:hypothetical protein
MDFGKGTAQPDLDTVVRREKAMRLGMSEQDLIAMENRVGVVVVGPDTTPMTYDANEKLVPVYMLGSGSD